MPLAIVIFAVTFVVILVVNQMFYGGCFEAHCLSAAFPKVIMLSTLVSWFLYSAR
jgi:hypothetical protein